MPILKRIGIVQFWIAGLLAVLANNNDPYLISILSHLRLRYGRV
jgi:hypothetical protein